MKIRTKICAIIMMGAALLVGCSTHHKTIKILAVNDIHAALDRFPQFAFMVNELRAEHPHLLLVSAGDNQTGHPANDQYPERGLPVIELMNALKFDLSAVVNHEFDSRLTGFEYLTHQANFDFLATNTELPQGADFRIKPYQITEMPNGLKIAFMSLLEIGAVGGIPHTHPDNVQGFVFRDPLQSAKAHLFLKDQSDVLIMLNHLGFEEDVTLAKQLPVNSIDLIIGGHSHTKVETNQTHNGVLITQAKSKLNYATLISLEVSPEGRITKSMQLLSIDKAAQADPTIQEMVNAYNNNPALTEIIAIAEDAFSSAEEIGYLMTDAIRAESGSDLAFLNAGGVRLAELTKGPIRVQDIYEMDPFGNEIIAFNLTGQEIRSLFHTAFNSSGYKLIYPSGMRVRYVLHPDESLKEVEFFTSTGAPFDMNKTYSVVMNDYMASVYHYEHKDPGQRLFKLTAETTIDHLKKTNTISSYRGIKRVELK